MVFRILVYSKHSSFCDSFFNFKNKMYLCKNSILIMGKYVRDLDIDLEKKVKDMAVSRGLKAQGVSVEAVRIKKCKTYGEVLKGNDLVTLFTNDPRRLCVALYDDLFDNVDPETQDYWIESLVSQISYDSEKDKVVLTKPELSINREMYYKYSNVAVQKEELALHTIQQIADEKKKEKEEAKARRLEKKMAKMK